MVMPDTVQIFDDKWISFTKNLLQETFGLHSLNIEIRNVAPVCVTTESPHYPSENREKLVPVYSGASNWYVNCSFSKEPNVTLPLDEFVAKIDTLSSPTPTETPNTSDPTVVILGAQCARVTQSRLSGTPNRNIVVSFRCEGGQPDILSAPVRTAVELILNCVEAKSQTNETVSAKVSHGIAREAFIILSELLLHGSQLPWRESDKLDSSLAALAVETIKTTLPENSADFFFVVGRRILKNFDHKARVTSEIPLRTDHTTYTLRNGVPIVVDSIPLMDGPNSVHRNKPALAIVPVVVGTEPRALFRIGGAKEDLKRFVKSTNCRLLSHCIGHAISRRDEFVQAHQTTSALAVGTASLGGKPVEEQDILGRAAAAMGAKWALFYELEMHGHFAVRQCLSWSQTGIQPESLSQPDVLVRKDGLTQALYNCQRRMKDKTVVWVLHRPYRKGEKEPYLLSVSVGREQSPTQQSIKPPLWNAYGYVDCTCDCEDCTTKLGINLNSATRAEEGNSLVGFVGRLGEQYHGVIWLQLPVLRDVRKWEEEFFHNVAGAVGQALSLNGLSIGLRAFRHTVPDAVTTACDCLFNYSQNADSDHLKVLETCVRALREKVGEVKCFLPEQQEQNTATEQFSRQSIKACVDMAVIYVTQSAAYDDTVWQSQIPDVVSEQKVSGVFYCVLINLLSNVQKHAHWHHLFPENTPKYSERLAFVLVETPQDERLVAYVGNTGIELTTDPFLLNPKGDHGIGLRAMKMVLATLGGVINWVPPTEISSLTNERLKRCNAVFRVEIPC